MIAIIHADCANPKCKAYIGQIEVLPEEKVCPDGCSHSIIHVGYEVTCPRCGVWEIRQRISHPHRVGALTDARR